MEKKLLPIGTVVILKKGTKKIMIIGYFPSEISADNSKTYDYSGIPYPEGLIDSRKILLFNSEQIENIFYSGYADEEQKQFFDKINSLNTTD